MNRSSRLAALGAGATLLAAIGVAPVLAAAPTTAFLIVDDDNGANIGDGTNSAQCDDAITVPNVTFSTINAAVTYAAANLSAGNVVVFVCPGTYNENVTIGGPNIDVRGPQGLKGQTECKPRLYQASVIGTGSGPAISVNADGVKVRGLRIANTRGAGISVSNTSNDVRISNNIIVNNAVGIDLSSSSEGRIAIVRNCITDNNNGGPGSGIASLSAGLQHARITRNRFAAHRAPAIDLKEGADIASVRIAYNVSFDDRMFLRIDGASGIGVVGNAIKRDADISFESSSVAAIQVKGAASDIELAANRFRTNHPRGISVDDPATGVTITRNRFSDVGDAIVVNSAVAGAVNVTDNRFLDILGTAMLFGATTNGNTIDGNDVEGVANFACNDASTGALSGGTNNTWSNTTNPLGWSSNPSEICPQTPA